VTQLAPITAGSAINGTVSTTPPAELALDADHDPRLKLLALIDWVTHLGGDDGFSPLSMLAVFMPVLTARILDTEAEKVTTYTSVLGEAFRRCGAADESTEQLRAWLGSLGAEQHPQGDEADGARS
jgi:hypothetical protein